MEYTYVTMKVQLTKEEKASVKAIAKSQGMTLQGYIAAVLKKELEKSKEIA